MTLSELTTLQNELSKSSDESMIEDVCEEDVPKIYSALDKQRMGLEYLTQLLRLVGLNILDLLL